MTLDAFYERRQKYVTREILKHIYSRARKCDTYTVLQLDVDLYLSTLYSVCGLGRVEDCMRTEVYYLVKRELKRWLPTKGYSIYADEWDEKGYIMIVK